MTGAGMAVPGLDELGGIGVIAHPVTDEPQPGQGSLHRLPRCRVLGPHDRFVCSVVIPHQGGIDEGDPPYGVVDHLEAARLVWWLLPGKPLYGVTHGGDGPVQRARPGLRVSGVFLVPGDPAGSRAEPGVLAAWCEHGAALLTGPGIGHLPMLRTPHAHASVPMLRIPCAHAGLTIEVKDRAGGCG